MSYALTPLKIAYHQFAAIWLFPTVLWTSRYRGLNSSGILEIDGFMAHLSVCGRSTKSVKARMGCFRDMLASLSCWLFVVLKKFTSDDRKAVDIF